MRSQPSVLRCSRCGKLVDWPLARLSVICDCKPHYELPVVLVRPAEPAEKDATVALYQRDFGHTDLLQFGEIIPLEPLPAFVAEVRGELAGALAYRWMPDAIHIVALATDPMWQRSGVGGQLVEAAEGAARRKGVQRIVVATTNDNLPALYFYQRRGYHISEVVTGAMGADLARRYPEGVMGFAGIPVRDEIRLEKPVAPHS